MSEVFTPTGLPGSRGSRSTEVPGTGVGEENKVAEMVSSLSGAMGEFQHESYGSYGATMAGYITNINQHQSQPCHNFLLWDYLWGHNFLHIHSGILIHQLDGYDLGSQAESSRTRRSAAMEAIEAIGKSSSVFWG